MVLFQIVYSGLLKAELLRLVMRSRSEGRLGEAKAALQEILARLQSDPMTAGEKIYELKHIGLPVRHFVRRPWSVHFAVDESGRIVYLSRVLLLE